MSMDVCSMSHVGRWEVWKCVSVEASEVVETADAGDEDFAVHGLKASWVISDEWAAAAACWWLLCFSLDKIRLLIVLIKQSVNCFI